jgi:hypothetical protein
VATALASGTGPRSLAAVSPDPSRSPDQLSARWLLALGSRLVQEVGALLTGAARARQRVATFGIDAEVRFASGRWRSCWPPIICCPARRRDPDKLPDGLEVISASHTDVQSTLLVRTSGPVLDPAWTVSEVSLEDLVLAYMSQAAGHSRRNHHLEEVPK